MLMVPIAPPRRHDYLVVRLLRRWASERESGGDQLPSLVRLGRRLGVEPQAAIAVASMFQLTEHCLGRPLQAECCCSPRLSRDEQAMLLLLHQSVPAVAIPHGLPGALLWAVASVRRSLDIDGPLGLAFPARCPFETSTY